MMEGLPSLFATNYELCKCVRLPSSSKAVSMDIWTFINMAKAFNGQQFKCNIHLTLEVDELLSGKVWVKVSPS
jgi:hypothetical protein